MAKDTLLKVFQPKTKMILLLIHPHVVPNLYDFFPLWKIKGDILRHASKLFDYQEFVFHRKKPFRVLKMNQTLEERSLVDYILSFTKTLKHKD